MLLATAGSDVFSQLDRFKESFLWAAAKGGRVEECESLLQMGTDVNWVSPEGDTPLLAACRNGHVPAALCLLDNGAEVDLAAGDGQTALHFCCRHGNEAIAEALIIRGASVQARDNRGATAFEIPGPRAPTGMLRRLNTIAQRRQDHDHSAGSVSVPGSTSTSTHETSISDARQFRHLNAISGNATSGNAIAGNPRSGSEESRSGRRISGHQERPVDTADSAWSLRSAVLRGGRDESPRGEGRTTFPSIAPSVATSHRTLQSGPPRPGEILARGYTTRVPSERVGPGSIEMSVTSRNLEMHRHAARGGEALRKAAGTGMQLAAIRRGESSSDGFQSSDDDNDDNELFEVGTGIRLVGGVYHGSNTRQGSLPGRNRPGRSLFPENMSLMSAGEPVPSASAAIAAAIASAASPVTADPSYSTIPDTTPVVSPSRQPVDATPRGGTGSSGSGGGRGSRDDGSGGSSSSSSSSSSIGGSTGAASHTQAASTSATPALYGSTSITNVAGDGGAETTRGAERGAGAGTTRGADRGVGGREELVRRLGSGDVPMAPLGSDDSSSEDKGGMTRPGFNALEERSGANDHVELIRMLWLQEKESRLAAEAKAEAVRDQSARLWNELVRSEKQVLSLEEAVENAHKERDKLKATLRGHGLKGRSLQELEQLEKDFRKALEGVCGERDRIVQGQLAKEEQRLCVVCQENERGVLLLPCRHLCVCRSCSERQELTLCPLCRDNIAESLVVYS